jgi:hypothetical protein
MAACRVTLVRARTLTACGVALLASAAVAAAAEPTPDLDGGMALPGATLPGEPLPAPTSSVPSAIEPVEPTTPATQEGTIVGSTAAVAAPPLATPLRRESDPVTQDLVGLLRPSAIAAVDGHVVIVRPRGGRSELVDVADPARPRILLSSTRAFGTPNGGHDAQGRPVVVASPCAGTDEVVLLHRDPNCPLRVVDLTTGVSSAVPGSTGALQGDVERGRVAFTRQSPQVGFRLYVGSGGAIPTPVALPKMAPGAPNWPSTIGTPAKGSLSAGALDVAGDGRVAVVIEHRSRRPRFTSSLWVRDASAAWHRQVSVNTPHDDLGVRRVLGPRLDDGGVRAYVEGVVDGPSFVGRWTIAGQSTTRFSIRRSIGRATIVRDAAYDGERLVFVDWLPGLPCGSVGANACGLRAVGPISIR